MTEDSNITEGDRNTIETDEAAFTKHSHSNSMLLTDEPPIGIGTGSFFFDFPVAIADLNPTPSDGKYRYKLEREYTGIAVVSVITEEFTASGNVSFATYSVPGSEKRAKLVLSLETPGSGGGSVEIPGDDGSIVLDQALENHHELTEKRKRPYRLKHPSAKARILDWKIVNSSGNVIVDNGVSFSGSGDDYYFYVSMYHDHIS